MKWTAEHVEALRAAVVTVPAVIRNDHLWAAVAEAVSGHTPAACQAQAARLGLCLGHRRRPLAVCVSVGYGLVCECGARAPWAYFANSAMLDAWAVEHAQHRRRYFKG